MISSVTSPSFRRYGKVIDYPNQQKKGTVRNLWRIIHVEKAKVGWRIAYLVLRDKTIGRLECHLFSDETFEPVRGKALIFFAEDKRLADIKCFTLDKPIIVHKGVWHGLVSISAQTEIKITENAKVSCRYWNLGFRIKHPRDLHGRA